MEGNPDLDGAPDSAPTSDDSRSHGQSDDGSASLSRPEFVFGFAAPLGTDLRLAIDSVAASLRLVGYQCSELKLTHLLRQLLDEGKYSPGFDVIESPEADRISSLQKAGTRFRSQLGVDAMSLLALNGIRTLRTDPDVPEAATAYLLNQLKHPGEADLLSDLFGDRFILIGAGSSRDVRRRNLARRLAESEGHFDTDTEEAKAVELINTDENEGTEPAGQHVRQLFPMADLFVDPSDPATTSTSVERFVELLFGNSFHTPSIDELGMRLAHTMALRSAALSRQVGAVITRSDGSLIAGGANDVPRAGGGVYWPHHEPDGRDHVIGRDSSNDLQQRMIAEFLAVLAEHDWLKDDVAQRDSHDLVEDALSTGMLSGLRAISLVEFGRTLHAEMNAILDASRHGTAVADATLFSTTYPCHECTRHIIGAGVRRVVFVEPYPKSLAETLHQDAVDGSGSNRDGAVSFDSFVGVAPRRFDQLFTMRAERKDKLTGRVITWNPAAAEPVVSDRWGPTVARAVETLRLSDFLDRLEQLGSEDSGAVTADS